jgi:hypothetical protein
MLDTTRVRRIGVGHHRRKNDAIDAEVIAMARADNRVPLAHVLSPERCARSSACVVRPASAPHRGSRLAGGGLLGG